MEILRFEDLIEWVRHLHSYLAQSMKDSVADNENEMAKALLTYLADHEKELVRITEEFERQADPKALKTWIYDVMEHKPINVNWASDKHFADMDVDSIAREVFRFHDEVVSLYDQLSGVSHIPEAKELMDSLQEMEEHESMRLAQQIASSQDL